MKKSCKKRIMSLVFAFIMVSSYTISVNAQENFNMEPCISIEEQIDIISNDPTLSENERTIALELLLNANSESESRPPMLRSVYERNLSVPFYRQETDWWCGAASVKQIVNYYNGSSSSQNHIVNNTSAYINNSSGHRVTDSTLLTNYIKSCTGKQYVHFYPSSESTFRQNVKNSIYANRPLLIGYKPSTSNGFPYTAGDHFSVVSGIIEQDHYGPPLIQITDPYITWKSSSSYHSRGTYHVYIRDALKALNSLWG